MLNYEEIPLVLTVKDVAKLLKVGKNTIYDLVRSGRLKGLRVGKSIRISKSAFIAYIDGD